MKTFANIFLRTFLLFILFSSQTTAQSYDNNWMTGLAGLYKGGIINFGSGAPNADSINANLPFDCTNTSMSDSFGNLLFFTNGIYVYDSSYNIMLNGDSLSPCVWSNSFSTTGLNIINGALIIPMPGQNNLYYLFHESWDLYNTASSFHPATFYSSIIDMTLNNGLGSVTQKNDPLYYLSSGLVSHGYSATKHANGRDWWLIHHKAQTNEFVKWLITPSGINGPYIQAIGLPPFYLASRDLNFTWCFPPDGSQLAFIAHGGGSNGSTKRVDYFNFDRCTGSLSAPLNFYITDSSYRAIGLSYSPSGRFLYVNSDYLIYQYDTWASNIDSSRQTVAVYDGNLYLGYKTVFVNMQLGPDGKIYIAGDAAPDYISVINDPDSLGVACNVTQHSFNTVVRTRFLPNYPNYRLGSLAGSACDTLTGIAITSETRIGVKLTPNPNNGSFTVNYSLPQNTKGSLKITDVIGRNVYEQYLPPFSNTQRLQLKQLPQGLYFCCIKTNNAMKVVKFLVE